MPYWVYVRAGDQWKPDRSFFTRDLAVGYAEKQKNLWENQGMKSPGYKICYGADTVAEI